ncbi:HET-domain-containing protein, partial [Viridothelium virens]
LKLINCQTFEVVSAPENASYVALSYVWGTATSHYGEPSKEDDGSPSLDPRIAKTIQDTLVVAKALGYKYLWVDRLCIDQKNAEEKHDQISQMDSIYGGADLTVITACGQDCHYGLPGINATSRTSQSTVKIGRITIFTSTLHPHRRIHSSKWAERGWTLQEIVLSTRRVVFTDDQFYFECNTMHCSESIAPD